MNGVERVLGLEVTRWPPANPWTCLSLIFCICKWRWFHTPPTGYEHALDVNRPLSGSRTVAAGRHTHRFGGYSAIYQLSDLGQTKPQRPHQWNGDIICTYLIWLPWDWNGTCRALRVAKGKGLVLGVLFTFRLMETPRRGSSAREISPLLCL